MFLRRVSEVGDQNDKTVVLHPGTMPRMSKDFCYRLQGMKRGWSQEGRKVGSRGKQSCVSQFELLQILQWWMCKAGEGTACRPNDPSMSLHQCLSSLIMSRLWALPFIMQLPLETIRVKKALRSQLWLKLTIQ